MTITATQGQPERRRASGGGAVGVSEAAERDAAAAGLVEASSAAQSEVRKTSRRPALWRRAVALYQAARQIDPFAGASLAGRIVVVNLVLFAVLVGVTLLVSQYRSDLIEQRINALKTEANIIAISIAEAAGEPLNQTYDWVAANAVLRRLSLPTGLRAQIYDRTGRLSGDTRSLLGGGFFVEQAVLDDTAPTSGLFRRLEELYDRVSAAMGQKLELYRETQPAGISNLSEVYEALEGEPASKLRVNSENELIISVAVPVQRVKTVLGVLVLSTEGGDIDRAVRRERTNLLSFFFLAFLANVAFSLWLARNIARPIRRLAIAAESNEIVGRAPNITNPVEIPDYSYRADEIGHLSHALRRMTKALYDRMGAISSFAADVAHEIKNPLTSLRSAVESMTFAKTEAQRERLFGVITHDVDRLDRLVTDISNASRLDAELVREQREMFDFAELLTTVTEIAQPQAEDRGVTIQLDLPSGPGALTARGLKERLAQVFHNLIDNGLSFSAAGDKITVVARPATIDDRPAIRVEIADEGPGIPEENLEEIFQRFYSSRPDAEPFGRHSGLGLSICRQIVEAHGGRIWAENRTDRSGALFIVLAPR